MKVILALAAGVAGVVLAAASVMPPAAAATGSPHPGVGPTDTAPVGGASVGGSIRGVVRKAGTNTPVPNAPVQLVFITGPGAEPVSTGRSNASGRFEFPNLMDGRYLITARHQGVSYAAHAVVGGGATEVTVQVYDVSTKVALRVSLLGMAVDAQKGFVRVNEVLHLQNPTTQTFLGEVTVPLPTGARFVVFNEGFHQPRATGPSITDRMIVRPGGHQLAYTYSVRGDGEVALTRRLGLAVDRLELFVTAPAEARSSRLRALPSVTNEDGRTFTRASGRAVPPGDLAVVVAGVPSARLWLPPAAAGTLAAVLVVGLMWAISRTAP